VRAPFANLKLVVLPLGKDKGLDYCLADIWPVAWWAFEFGAYVRFRPSEKLDAMFGEGEVKVLLGSFVPTRLLCLV